MHGKHDKHPTAANGASTVAQSGADVCEDKAIEAACEYTYL